MVRFCGHKMRSITRLGFAQSSARRLSVSLSYYFVETRVRGKDGRACLVLNGVHVRGVDGRVGLIAYGVSLLQLNDCRAGHSWAQGSGLRHESEEGSPSASRALRPRRAA